MTLWGRRSLLQSSFNLSATALAIWIAAHTFYWLAGTSPGGQDLIITSLLVPLFILASLYFLVNTGLVAIALGFERRTNAWTLWREHFSWFSLNYFGGVSVAALLVSYTRSVDIAAVSIILPLLIIAYLTHRSSLGPDFRFGCGTFAHSISRQALIFAGFSRETRPRRVTPSG